MNALAMQSTLTPRFAVADKAARPTGSRCARTSVIVRASSQETRRQVLSGLVAGVVSLTALKAGAVDLQDERDVRQRGFDLIYEARDLDLDQSTRDGLTQYRKNIDSTKARIKEAERILDNNLDPLIQKKYWYATSAVLQPHLLAFAAAKNRVTVHALYKGCKRMWPDWEV
ncbi:TPA: hypothetical protein ACH3X1_003591 [Trebouxia sp. C0004]